MMRKRQVRKLGFTLVELLTVVIILGILAAAVIPLFADAGRDAQFGALVQNLAIVRGQLELYKLEHLGNYPAPLAQFANKMTQKTNPDGTTGGSPTLGPYLDRIPDNPYTTGSQTNQVTSSSPAPTRAWWYDPTTGEFRANDGGTTKDGVPHASL